jgi:hypothetical protein
MLKHSKQSAFTENLTWYEFSLLRIVTKHAVIRGWRNTYGNLILLVQCRNRSLHNNVLQRDDVSKSAHRLCLINRLFSAEVCTLRNVFFVTV